MEPGDYTATSGTLNFTGTTGEMHNVVVTIIDDDLIEPTEGLFVNLSGLTTTLIGINDGQGAITIQDNDGGLQNGLSISDVTVNEGDGTATVSVTLKGNVQGGFSVDYDTGDATAVNSEDYTTSSGNLTFEGFNGETQTITIPIIYSNLIEATENFTVNLSNLSTNLININDDQGAIIIIDHDVLVQNDSVTIIDGVAVNIDILSNDSFGPDDTIENIVLTGISFGTLTLNSNNIITHTSGDEIFYDTITFNYTVTVINTNGSSDEVTGTVTLYFLLTLVVEDDFAETESNIPIDIDILENDFDIDGTIDLNSLIILNDPENGMVTINSDGSVTYTPDLDFIGEDTFTYEVCDNSGLCNTAEVTVVVAGVLGAELNIPEGFSPNGDGVHDVFEIKGLSNLYPDFELQIYNRWGNVVYDYKHNGNPLTEPIWWDGYSNGRMTINSSSQVPAGTYFYTLYFNKDNAKPRAGYVYLNK